jgi:hypothetical protein
MTESPTAVTCPGANPAAGGGRVLVVAGVEVEVVVARTWGVELTE